VSEPDARRVVVIDDSPLQCAAWRKMFERRYGARAAVETYTDPVVAVDVLRPDVHLVLLDWEMPVLNGEAVLEAAQVVMRTTQLV